MKETCNNDYKERLEICQPVVAAFVFHLPPKLMASAATATIPAALKRFTGLLIFDHTADCKRRCPRYDCQYDCRSHAINSYTMNYGSHLILHHYKNYTTISFIAQRK